MLLRRFPTNEGQRVAPLSRGDVFWLERNDPNGWEIWKPRPWVVISDRLLNDKIPMVILVPLSSLDEAKELRLPGEATWIEVRGDEISDREDPLDERDRVALCAQVWSVSHDRLPLQRSGKLTLAAVNRIANGVAVCIGAE